MHDKPDLLYEKPTLTCYGTLREITKSGLVQGTADSSFHHGFGPSTQAIITSGR